MRSENANNRVTALAGVLSSGGRLGLRGKTAEYPTFSIPKTSFAHTSTKSCFDTLSESPSPKDPPPAIANGRRSPGASSEGTTSDVFALQSHQLMRQKFDISLLFFASF
jgi:hypothetical protein